MNCTRIVIWETSLCIRQQRNKQRSLILETAHYMKTTAFVIMPLQTTVHEQEEKIECVVKTLFVGSSIPSINEIDVG